jgi:hypothetical protein
MERLCFPTDAKEDLLIAFDKIAANGSTFPRFFAMLKAYEEDCHLHFVALQEELEKLCEIAEVHPYAGKLMFYLSLADGMRAHYRAQGIDEALFWNALADLGYKLEECRLVQGMNGSFVGNWFAGFFKLERFALGRLQFELTTVKKPYTCAGFSLSEGQTAINIHIPRTGTRLCHDEVLAAYEMARDFFRASFPDGQALFACHSWLLDPWNLTVLRPDSNLAAFIRDFEIVEVDQYPDYAQLWRLFDCKYTGDPEDLPGDSSLRRAYKERVKRGEKTAAGLGYFILK